MIKTNKHDMSPERKTRIKLWRANNADNIQHKMKNTLSDFFFLMFSTSAQPYRDRILLLRACPFSTSFSFTQCVILGN